MKEKNLNKDKSSTNSEDLKKNNKRRSFRRKHVSNTKVKDPGVDKGLTSGTRGSNDPAWWVPNTLDAQHIASYPWNTMAGFDIRDAVKGARGTFTSEEAPNIAGICRLTMQSTVPLSDGDSSALNRASLGLFADILTKNSSNVPFEHVDLMMSMIALADIDAWLVAGMRVYGLLRKYPVQNKYLAKALVTACGFDYDSLISDPYSFVARLNVYISRRNRFYIPKKFNWRSREVWLNTGIYKDSDDPKSQFYLFVKDSYSVWSPRSDTNGSSLLQRSCYIDYGATLTQDQYFSILDTMLEPLENDQDIYIMQGYLLKRYDVSEFVIMPSLSTDMITEPIIDYSVLTMIQNAKIYTDTSMLNGQYTAITQSNGHFEYKPSFITSGFNTGNILLTSPHNNPTPEDTIEATRLIIPVENVEVTQNEVGIEATFVPAGLNADVVSSLTFVSLKSNGELITFNYDGVSFHLPVNLISASHRYLLTQISYFDFHPIITVSNYGNSLEFVGFIGDFDNTMILTQENLKRMTEITSYGIVNIVDIIK